MIDRFYSNATIGDGELTKLDIIKRYALVGCICCILCRSPQIIKPMTGIICGRFQHCIQLLCMFTVDVQIFTLNNSICIIFAHVNLQCVEVLGGYREHVRLHVPQHQRGPAQGPRVRYVLCVCLLAPVCRFAYIVCPCCGVVCCGIGFLVALY